jgi:hypothetical protein
LNELHAKTWPAECSCVLNWKEFDSLWLAANQEGQFGTTFDMLACSVACHGVAGPDQIVGPKLI